MAGVKFTESAARRIAAATLAVEGGGRDQPPIKFRAPPSDEGGGDGEPVRIGKTTAQWTKGTLATIRLYEEGAPPGETATFPVEEIEDCVNKFGTVASNKWVALMKGTNGYYYLIAAEC
jgi:hypothetical protein